MISRVRINSELAEPVADPLRLVVVVLVVLADLDRNLGQLHRAAYERGRHAARISMTG